VRDALDMALDVVGRWGLGAGGCVVEVVAIVAIFIIKKISKLERD
jgi:hypothetical protein